jgi:hypothetical protein
LIELTAREALGEHAVVAFERAQVLVVAIKALLAVLLDGKDAVSLVLRIVKFIA